MLDPVNLTGDDLDAYIYPRTGQVRNAATKAVGVLTVTGSGTIADYSYLFKNLFWD